MKDTEQGINRSLKWVMLFLLVFLFGGCAGNKTRQEPFFDKWKVKAQTSRGNTPAPIRHGVGLPEQIDEAAGDRMAQSEPQAGMETENRLPTNKISLKMHAIDLSVLLRAMAKAAGQNIMINEKVAGKANINITQAPWDQVFLGILRTHGLSYSWEGDIIRIMTADDMDQDLKKAAQRNDFRLIAPPITRVVKINYAEAKQLRENLEKFLSKNQEGNPLGSVMVDEHTNSLIIQAIRPDAEQILDLIEALDRPTPQVLIEAHIVEATKTTAMELGVQWGGLSKNGFWMTPGANSSGVIGNTLATGIDPTSGWASNFPATGVSDTIGLTVGFAVEDIGSSIIAMQLSALEQEGKLNILSSPSITTLDNQKAVIESGSEVPYQTVEDGEVKIEFKKAVLSLEVTPHVIDGKTLKMKIFTKKDELDFTNAVQGQPAINTKKAETNVLLFDGQTTVIGGLTKEKTQRSEAGVPGLKDVPLLGWLFRNNDNQDEMDDLLIFITPHILKEREYDSDQRAPKDMPPPEIPSPQPEAIPR